MPYIVTLEALVKGDNQELRVLVTDAKNKEGVVRLARHHVEETHSVTRIVGTVRVIGTEIL